MSNEVKKYLLHIYEAIEFIESETKEIKNFGDYQKSRLLKPAIERKLEIIGEATNKATKLINALPITSKEKIISMRNYLIHAYDSIDDFLVYEIIKTHLPLLKTEVQKLLED
ncbi:MAG: DUF86 domain-containing protein [Bacteroidetes bacterium]|nr:DUF86 domain-containing protein [Bacteroidota bacterium]